MHKITQAGRVLASLDPQWKTVSYFEDRNLAKPKITKFEVFSFGTIENGKIMQFMRAKRIK